MFRYYYAFFKPFDTLLKTLFSVLFLVVRCKYNPKLNSAKSEIRTDKCYVLGNGPSLKTDIIGKEDYLTNQTLFVANHFSKSNLFESLKPEFYVLADGAFWNEAKCVETTRKLVESTLVAIKIKTVWQMILFIPHEAYGFFKNYFKSNSNIRIISYNKTAIDGYKFFRYWTYRKNLSMPPAQTVLNAAIFIGINLGFKEINLLGADHTWHKNLYLRDDNLLFIADDHFYDNEKPRIKPITVNFINEKIPKVHDELFSAAKALESHHKISEYAKSRNVKIYNRTSTTFIDAYERKSFTDLT